jgi:hypothetical protein
MELVDEALDGGLFEFGVADAGKVFLEELVEFLEATSGAAIIRRHCFGRGTIARYRRIGAEGGGG